MLLWYVWTSHGICFQAKGLKLISTTKEFLKKHIGKHGGLSELEKTTSLSFIRGIGNLLQSFAYEMDNTPEMNEINRLRVSFTKQELNYALLKL